LITYLMKAKVNCRGSFKHFVLSAEADFTRIVAVFGSKVYYSLRNLRETRQNG